MNKPQPIDDVYSGSDPSHRSRWGVVLAGLLGAALVGAAWMASAWQRGPQGIYAPKGNLQVHYMIMDTPTSSSGSTMERVSAIEPHPGYILVRTLDGAGQFFFTETTRRLSWNKVEPSESDVR